MTVAFDRGSNNVTIYLESGSLVNKIKRKLSKYGWPSYYDHSVLLKSLRINDVDLNIYVKCSSCHLKPVSKVLADWFSKPYSQQIALELQRRLDKK